MKNIDLRSLLIGILLTTTVFFGIGATSPDDKWDKRQQWQVRYFQDYEIGLSATRGWEPISGHIKKGKQFDENHILCRKRTD